MTLPVCVIGAGSIGIRHIEVALASDKVHLTGIVEPNAAQRKKLADQGLAVFETIDDLPDETRAASIATPTQDHKASTLAALDRGIAVLVEKPTAGTPDDARAMIAAAEKAGLPLYTGHHRRCHPFSITARDELAKIGDLVGLQGFWSLRKHNSYYDADWRRKAGAGPLMTNLSHEMDLLRFMIGEIDEVTALSSNARRGFEIEDTAALALRFAGGALGSFLISDAGASPWSFEAASAENPIIAASGEDYIRITGTEGALVFPSLTRWGRSGPGEIEWSKPLARIDGPQFAKVDPLLEQINRFAHVLEGGQDDVLCTGADGLVALELTLATALSAKTGKPASVADVPGDYRGV